ncbi:MAG: DegV family protein [Chloroflexi bacterium]|nr:DegV family protein [Chloroflexota bacterium]
MLQVVVDSTADIPANLTRDLDVQVVPVTVRFGNDVYLDGVDLAGDAFYEKLRASPTLPTTAAPAPADFAVAFRRALDAGRDILAITVSSKVSSTYNSALLAAAEVGPERVAVVDSLSASMGCGLLALRVAEAARQGASLAEARRLAADLVPRAHLYVAVDTLESLRRGGRIGHASAWLGTLLNIKPLIAVDDGEVHPVERIRTLLRCLARVAEMTGQRAPDGRVAVGYTDAPDLVRTLVGLVEQAAPGREVIVYQAGPAVGTHAGRGAVGVAFLGSTQRP